MYANLGGSYSWMFDPPPYDFLAPANSAPMPAPILGGVARAGLGCGCGCSGAGKCGGGHSHGLGLFESGLDYSQWTFVEWSLAAVGVYLVINVASDMLSVGRGAKRIVQKRRRRSQIRQKYQQELATL